MDFPLTTGKMRNMYPWNEVRLSQDVRPSHYNVSLFPQLIAGTFSGKVTISVNVMSKRDYISIHAKGLNIQNSKIMKEISGAEMLMNRVFLYEPREVYVFLPKHAFEPGQYKIFAQFDGNLTKKIVGFYRSTYKDDENKEKYIASSKFEPTFARQAFPCFDEPEFKASFDVELVKPNGKEYLALSNMEKLEEYPNLPQPNLSTVKFATSKPMSTYLVCFIVCDFGSAGGNVTKGGFPVNVYARKSQIENVYYAKNVALEASNFYLEYFDIPYPLSKLDLIAIPDFVSGAMENWGLITFRESKLLCNDTDNSVNTKLNVALTVCHEIAHMWFGDLVTMKWWSDLWLNEGFATFIEYKAVDHINPTWDVDGIFLINELFHVLNSDSSLSSHPIIMPVHHPDQITEIFDSISYSKGASVIRMLENTIRQDNFRKGIHNYLKEFQFKNVETDQLWSHLNKAADNVDVLSFMETWTLQMGFPVINVSVNPENLTITFSQQRFLLDPGATYDKSTSPYGYMWEVPITYISSLDSKTVVTLWLKKTQESVIIPYDGKMKWIKVNFHHFGYYVVNYGLPMWRELNVILHNSQNLLDPSDRAGLLFDAFTLAEANKLSYEYALDMTTYLSNETHYIPWAVASRHFHSLLRRLQDTMGYELFKKYINSLINNMPALNWDVDDRASYVQKSLQSVLLEIGCTVGNTTCVNQAVSLFKRWIDAPGMRLHSELSRIILKFGTEKSTRNEWNRLWYIYLKEDDPQEKVKFMSALCSARDPDIMKNYLQLGKDEAYVRSQDYLTLLIIASRNPIANPLIWDFVRNEWEYLVSRYTLNDRYLGRIIPEVTSAFSTEIRLTEMREFYNKYPEAGAGERGRRTATETVENNIKWRVRYLSPIIEWLTKRFDTKDIDN